MGGDGRDGTCVCTFSRKNCREKRPVVVVVVGCVPPVDMTTNLQAPLKDRNLLSSSAASVLQGL